MAPLTPILDLKSKNPRHPVTFDADLRSEMIKSDKECPSNHREIQKAVIKVPGRWIASTAVLEVMEYPFSHYQFLNQDAQLVNLEPPKCTTTSVAFLSCALPVTLEPSSEKPSQQSYQPNEIADSHHPQSLSWFMERIICEKQFSGEWRSLTGTLALCAEYCSPPRPTIKWRRDAKSIIIAYEDLCEASKYERLLKTRPALITISVLRKPASLFMLKSTSAFKF
jgi:hypothetical protein